MSVFNCIYKCITKCVPTRTYFSSGHPIGIISMFARSTFSSIILTEWVYRTIGTSSDISELFSGCTETYYVGVPLCIFNSLHAYYINRRIFIHLSTFFWDNFHQIGHVWPRIKTAVIKYRYTLYCLESCFEEIPFNFYILSVPFLLFYVLPGNNL